VGEVSIGKVKHPLQCSVLTFLCHSSCREKALNAELAGLKEIEFRNPNGTMKLAIRNIYINLLGNGIPATRANSAVS